MKKVWLTALVFWVAVSALACWLYPVTLYDPCARYAPMADAFARGDFHYAFHPRFGVLFHVLTGALAWISGLAGIYCLQPVAFLFLVLSAVTMFAVVRRLSDSVKVAWWTFALVLVAPDFFRYALDGLREPVKCLVFALFGYSLVAKRSWPFALGLAMYIMTFTYGFGVASALLAVWCAHFAWRREWNRLPLPILGWSVGTAAVTVLTHAYTAHWLPAPQFISAFGRWL